MSHSAVSSNRTGLEIAIIGMAGRFPGARDIEQFWLNLRDGKETISFFSDEELMGAKEDPAVLNDPSYVRARGILEGADLFDASFFGFSPREAEILDPQQRLFLQSVWEAIESAGYDPESYKGSIGVYAGVGMSRYLFNLYSNREVYESVGGFQIMLGNDKDHLATRASYKINLKGPSVVVQTSCSTSLVAVHLACQSLLAGECDMAVAGGVTVVVPQKTGYFYYAGGIGSPDGHCRAFDARAQGTVAGNGVGVVLLKRLDDAIADNDLVHAVIKGSAINNDGSMKVGYTAPRADSQASVIGAALALAEVEPETIGYIETHGTGTSLGDAIEIAALAQAFGSRAREKNLCAIGSVKTNIGHLDTAAGVAGLIKTVLALKHRMIPPSLNFERPNPEIDFADSPLYVSTELSEWKEGSTPRRAGVSSFGIGGTNAHVILEEAPRRAESGQSRPWSLLLLSAKTSPALETATENLARHLEQNKDTRLADAAYTLQTGRRFFEHRRAVVCHDIDAVVAALHSRDSLYVQTGRQELQQRPVAFMFTGQGAQRVNMGLDLYQQEPDFRREVDHCCELLGPLLGLDLRRVLYPTQEEFESAAEAINQTYITQPALFVFEYALARLLMGWGMRPRAMIGHSVGEFVAACLAQVFSLEDALSIVALRGRLIQKLPGGAMLSTDLSEKEAEPYLSKEVSLAAVNGPSNTIISGPYSSIERLQTVLSERGANWRRLRVSHAFHSAMMEPILDEFGSEISRLRLAPPVLPYISNVTGRWIAPDEAADPGYWVRHLRQTVRYADGIGELARTPEVALLEVGPAATLSTMAKWNITRGAGQVVLSCIADGGERSSESLALLKAVGQLWVSGVTIDWHAFNANERRHKVSLPTYPFEGKRYWVESAIPETQASPRASSQVKRQNVSEWFYLPSWRRAGMLGVANRSTADNQQERWVVFADDCGLADLMIERLQTTGHRVTVVRPGSDFIKHSDHAYTIRPSSGDDYANLFAALRHLDCALMVAHFWSVSSSDPSPEEGKQFERSQELGFYSLTRVAQVVGRLPLTGRIKIGVVSSDLHEVTGGEQLRPDKATVLGPCKVIPQEYPNIACFNFDLTLEESTNDQQRRVIDELIAEFYSDQTDAVIAARRGYRWLQGYEPMRGEIGEGKAIGLRERGVYLVTGGLGQIGLLVAEFLASKCRARLALLGRSSFPSKSDWQAWLDSHDVADDLSRKIGRLKRLEEEGAEVLVLSAEVSDKAQMRRAIRCMNENFGDINGVVHAAGVVGEKAFNPIQDLSRNDCEPHFKSKAHGLFVIEDVLKGESIDFCLLFSSLSSVLGGLGYAAYAASNLFMDAYAYRQSRTGSTPWVSINWEGWRLGEQTQPVLAPAGSELSLTGDEGMQAFERILSIPAGPQVVVSTADLQARISKWIKLEPTGEADNRRATAPTELHPRPDLQTEFIAPATEIEKTLCEIWQRLLGVERLGTQDDFFELGGHSLLAVRLISEARKVFQVELPVHSLLESPTVKQMATLIEQAVACDDEDKPHRDQSAVTPHAAAGHRAPQREARMPLSLVELQPGQLRPPLFLVHPAGGTVFCYRDLVQRMDPMQSVYGLQSQGLVDDEVPLNRIEQMAARYIKAVRAQQPAGPYLLAGLSQGGVIAFEMAQQLYSSGEIIALLALFDSPGPGQVSFAAMDDAEMFVYMFGNQIPLSEAELRAMGPDEQLSSVLDQIKGAGILPADMGLSHARRFLQIWKANIEAMQNYTPRSYPGRVTFYRAAKWLPPNPRNPETPWVDLAAGGTEIRVMPGDHHTMIDGPNVKALAEDLQSHCDRARAIGLAAGLP